MSTLTRWVLAHKRIVVGFWVILTVVGIAAAGPASNALKQKFSVPGRDGYETNVQIAKHYSGTGGEHPPLVPVVTLPAGKTVDSPGVRKGLRAVDNRLEQALPGSRVASYGSTGYRELLLERLAGGAGGADAHDREHEPEADDDALVCENPAG